MASPLDQNALKYPSKFPEIIENTPERNVNTPVDTTRINKDLKIDDDLNSNNCAIEINPKPSEFHVEVPLKAPYPPMAEYSSPPQFHMNDLRYKEVNSQYPPGYSSQPHYNMNDHQYNEGNSQYPPSNPQYLRQPYPNIPEPTSVQQSSYLSSMYNQYSATKNDRRGFIKKVYSLLLIQLTMTVVFIALVVSIPQMREGIKRTVGLFYAALGIMLVLILAIMCFKKVARRYPWNYIALFTFTIFLSYIVAFISAFYNPFVVLSAVLLTFVVTLSLTIYAFKTKSDFTVCGGVLVSVTTSLILFGFLMIFFHPFYVNMIFCEIAIVLYSVFIVYDTQLIAGGRYNEISFDDYVIGALMLYVDIIGLFLYIMSLLGAKK